MDEQRALMDMLMGKTRDATDEERKTMRKTHFSDAKICKYAICGLCPYALFKGKIYIPINIISQTTTCVLLSKNTKCWVIPYYTSS